MKDLTLTFCPVDLVPGREVLLHCRVHDRLHLHLSTLPHPGENASGRNLQFGGESCRHCNLPLGSHQAFLDARAIGYHGVCRYKIQIRVGPDLVFLAGYPVPAGSSRICRMCQISGQIILQNEKSSQIIRHCRMSGPTLVLSHLP